MKRKKMFVMATVFAMLFGLAQIAVAATYSGPWETTDTQSSTYTITFMDDLTSGWMFGVYDIGDNSSPSSIVLIDSSDTYATFNITNNRLYVTQGMAINQYFDLTSSNDYFGFYFSDASLNTYYDYQYDTAGPVNQWLLKIDSPSPGSGGPVIASDVAPVPLPSSVIFLFSGFAGLVAFGSRRKIKK